MNLNKKLALGALLASMLLCFGCATELPSHFLKISTDSSDERSETERLEELRKQGREEAAQFCDTDKLESTATKVMAAIFPNKNLSGRLDFLYGLSPYTVHMEIIEVHENGERNPLRIAFFSKQDCSLWAMKVLK